MSPYYLLLCVVPYEKAKQVSDAAVKAGSFGGTVVTGKSISDNAVLDFLGLGGNTKELVLILTESGKKQDILSAIVSACAGEKKGFGYVCVLNADTLIKTGTAPGATQPSGLNSEGQEGSDMTQQTLVYVILNKGYADDAMSAARKAGATGGTVINARGTAREDDAKFFGVHIVPEKEMLLMVVDSDKREAVLNAVKSLNCLKEPGSGIAFCSNVEEFSALGKKQ